MMRSTRTEICRVAFPVLNPTHLSCVSPLRRINDPVRMRGQDSFHNRPFCSASSNLEDSPVSFEIPTRLNNVPHLRETRQFFYEDVASGVKAAIADGQQRLAVRCTIPETNPEMDVYRIGTLLELVRELAMELAQDGKCVKVCVQQSMGEGIFQGLPLSLAGVRRIMEVMDWGEVKPFVEFGEVGEEQVNEQCNYYILVAPQNIVGSSILTSLSSMMEAAEKRGKTLVLVNPILKDVPSSGGVMGVRGRKERIAFANSFQIAYHFRLLYNTGTYFPIKGALRYTYGGQWEVYKRVSYGKQNEGYEICDKFENQPDGSILTQVIRGQKKAKKRTTWW